MSDLNEEYLMSSPQERLDILNTIYNWASTTREEKEKIARLAQKEYNKLKGIPRFNPVKYLGVPGDTGYKALKRIKDIGD